MIHSSYRGIGLLGCILVFGQFVCFPNALFGQCDFVDDITGISLSVSPTGDAANPSLYTQVYVLTSPQGDILATAASPDFLGLAAGNYSIYAANYRNSEALAVAPLLALGQPWSGVEAYGDDPDNCLDYTAQPYSNCVVTVCSEREVCEFIAFEQSATGFSTSGYAQEYVLVINGIVEAIQGTGNFDLTAFPNATTGANAQVFALNYQTSAGSPVAVGDLWSQARAALCAGACIDYLGMNLDILPISQPSGSGISTSNDWLDNSNGCLGAQPPVNGGAPVSVLVNNNCVPSYGSGAIQARPLANDDLERYMSWRPLPVGMRSPCLGNMDLTQQPVFYTVECATAGPSDLEVEIANPGGNISLLEATIYGPVDPNCPVITGGTFIDCDDAGTSSLSGDALRNLQLIVPNAQPGQVYLVIVDTEGRDEFTININSTLLSSSLLAFRGQAEERKHLLSWQIEGEFDYAVLEHSLNGQDFRELSSVQAEPSKSSYGYTHQFPPTGLSYYRLRLHKQGQDPSYSQILSLSQEEDPNFSAPRLYPNPAKEQAILEFSSQEPGQLLEYEIRDMLGRKLYSAQSAVQSGLNQVPIDLQQLPAASYIVLLRIAGQSYQHRLVKSK